MLLKHRRPVLQRVDTESRVSGMFSSVPCGQDSESALNSVGKLAEFLSQQPAGLSSLLLAARVSPLRQKARAPTITTIHRDPFHLCSP